MQIKIKKFLITFWPVIFIFFVWFIFASPYFLKASVPFSSTYQVNFFPPWNAYPQFGSPIKNNAMPDVINQIYPWRHLAIEIWRSGQIPLWNQYSFSGTPLLANYQSAVLSPFNVLFFVLPFVDAWSVLVLLQPLLAGFFMYLLLRSLGRSNSASTIGSISFMFCGFITTWLGYATLGYAILFLPLSIYAIENYYNSNRLRFLFLLSITIPLSFFSGHFQISIYFFILTVIYIFYKSISTKKMRNNLFLMLYVFFGLLLSLPQILPSIEFYFQAVRSNIFEKAEAIPWQYVSTFLAPDFFGNPVTRNDWFGHYAEWNAYLGIIPFLLVIYSLLIKKRFHTIFLFILGILVLFLAFDTPILDLMVNLHIPVLATSAASRIIVVFSFLFAILAAYGCDDLIKDINKEKIKKISMWLFIFFLAFSFMWSIIFLKLFMPLDKISIAKSNLILPTIIFLFFAFSIFLMVFLKHQKKPLLFIFPFIIIALIAFDMLRFATKWQAFDPKNLVFANVGIAEGFSKIAGYQRVLGNFGAEASVYYHLPSVEGYDSLYSERYGEFMSTLNDGKIQKIGRTVVSFSKNDLYTKKAIDLLGIKYIVHKIADTNKVWTFPYWLYPKNIFKLVYSDDKYQIYENTDVLPRAFLVQNYRVVNSPQKIIDAILSDNFDLRKEVVLEENPQIKNVENIKGKAEIISYIDNKIKVKTNADNDSLLFLSDSFYPGWKAFVDGKETKIYRADYAFRAVAVLKGEHLVEFIYDPFSFKIGVYSAILGLIFIFGIPSVWRKKFI
ncbi:MAG: YfhO family protein [Candidatus Levyibacteriota bacterium]